MLRYKTNKRLENRLAWLDNGDNVKYVPEGR